jgi:zinc/manganese transport system substrate-binding protein
MRIRIWITSVLLLLGAALPAQAALKVLATTPEWGALVSEIGGEKVDVYTATTAFQDPHRIEARPSLIARARSADLLVAVGAQLEIGWLPVLLRESGNSRIQPGTPGYFEATAQLRLLEIPVSVDRALGDIHPLGNPHAHLDPHNIARVAGSLRERLAAIDAANAGYYQARTTAFLARWNEAIRRWETRASPLRGQTVVVLHRDQVYLCHWLGLVELAAIEPKPGIPPSAGHLAELVAKLAPAPPRAILRSAYSSAKAADWLGTRLSVPVVVLPYTVGGTPGAKDLFSLYDDTLNRLTGAIQ